MATLGGGGPYICKNCQNPIAAPAHLLSDKYWAKSGKAYLFSNVTNVVVGQSEDKMMLTGVYTIADISCNNCGEVLGWKYIRAHDDATDNKYKEGKFVLELSKIASVVY